MNRPDLTTAGPIRFLRTTARMGFVIAAWVLIALVFVQVFHAGSAVLVNPGDWSAHSNLGHLIAIPIMLMLLFSLIGWMPYRFLLISLGLHALYALQYLFLHLMQRVGLPALAALHPVNALVIFFTAYHVARDAWRVATEDWQQGASARRSALAVATVCLALGAAALGLRSGEWALEGDGPEAKATLATATEESIPAGYKAMQSPIPPGDAGAVAAGELIAQQRCIACHAADFKGKEVGALRASDLTRSARDRSAQFLMWAVSEGGRGMPSWKSQLSEEERWQVVAFLKSLQQ